MLLRLACCAVLLVCIGLLLGRAPTFYYALHTAMIVPAVLIRFVRYKKHGLQYYLADLCYFVNALLLLWIFCISTCESTR